MTRPGYDAAQVFLTLVRDTPPPCTQVNPDLFFPDTETYYEEAAKEAKAVCQKCPIIAQCLAYGLQINDQYGVYGGMSPAELRAWVRRQKLGVAA
jgi:WhiB family redox-sensing transcriptional regulator